MHDLCHPLCKLLILNMANARRLDAVRIMRYIRRMQILDAVPIDVLYEQYTDPRGGLGPIAAYYGVSFGQLYRRLTGDPVAWRHARAIRAQRLHEMAIAVLYESPERIVDTAGNERIDPSSVALLKYRSSEATRLAAILDNSLSERHQVDVAHTVSPLADHIARIAGNGSSVPIASDSGNIEDADIIDQDNFEDDTEGEGVCIATV
jgi:hypothetical protein